MIFYDILTFAGSFMSGSSWLWECPYFGKKLRS